MADRVKVIINNRQKDVKIPTGLRMLVRRCCVGVLRMENFEGPVEVSVSFVDMKEIQNLNMQFRGKNSPTDVLSFPMGEDGKYDVNMDTGAKVLGDVVICMKRAEEQAKLYGHPIQREVCYLTAHSMLHLLGYDHVNGGIEATTMREKEELVLEEMGLPSSLTEYKE